MSDVAQKWDQRYRDQDPEAAPPAEILCSHHHLLPRGGKALDLAMGLGRNAIYLATLGFEVTGIDISPVAVQKAGELAARRGVPLTALVADLEQYQIPPASYVLIVDIAYLQHSLIPQIIAALKPGGIVVFETFTIEHLRFKPDFNPDYLLQPGELANLFRSLIPRYYWEGIQDNRRAVATFIGQKPWRPPASP
ncbi:MAG: class I SAM-dependent methyltransferase [Deinococcus sp.]|nr:class I SAM-dependent methyltransferase [Deinococcus sp.]